MAEKSVWFCRAAGLRSESLDGQEPHVVRAREGDDLRDWLVGRPARLEEPRVE